MRVETAAKLFGELGNRTRLDILRLLMKAGHDGLPIGDVHSRLDIPLSTLAFHLRGLAEVELIEQEKQGRTVLCRPRFDRINEAIAFLKEECCAGVAHPGPLRRSVA